MMYTSMDAASSVRLCVETSANCAEYRENTSSRLRAAVC